MMSTNLRIQWMLVLFLMTLLFYLRPYQTIKYEQTSSKRSCDRTDSMSSAICGTI
jgi:hypothetical protein